jgi:hypothetical protein
MQQLSPVTQSLPLETTDWNDNSWMGRAACLGVEQIMFAHVCSNACLRRTGTRKGCEDRGKGGLDPKGGGAVVAARAICAGCPVQKECLTYSLGWNFNHGIWGGYTECERRVMRRILRLNKRAPTLPQFRWRISHYLQDISNQDSNQDTNQESE